MAGNEDTCSWPLGSLFDCRLDCSVQHLIEIAAVGNRKCLGVVGLHSSSDIFRRRTRQPGYALAALGGLEAASTCSCG